MFTFSLKRLMTDNRFQKCHFGKNPSFAEGGVYPRGLTHLFHLFSGFQNKKSLALKPKSAGLVESVAPSASLVIFLNLLSNPLKS